MDNSEWLKGLKVGDEVYLKRKAHRYDTAMETITSITGETPARWKVGKYLIRKSDGHLIGGGYIEEVTPQILEIERRKKVKGEYSELVMIVGANRNRVIALDTDKIDAISSKLKAAVEMIKEVVDE